MNSTLDMSLNYNTNHYNFFDAAGVYTQGTLDSGDTAWMLTATALVLLMTMPGLAIYYSGMVRDKNVLACKFYSCFVAKDEFVYQVKVTISFLH